jgi:sugar transferase (PEP-CTERM system associated)
MKVFGHHFYGPIVLVIVVEFVLAALSFYVCSVFVSPGVAGVPGFSGAVAVWASGFGLAVVSGVTAVGLYHSKQRLRIEGVLVRVTVGLLIAATLLALVDFILPVGIEGRLWVLSCALSLVLLAVVRMVFSRWLDRDLFFQRKVLIYGAGARAANILKLRRRSDRRGFHVTAFVPAEGDNPILADERVTRVAGSLVEHARKAGVEEIVVAVDDRRRGFPIAELLRCKFAGIAVIDLLSFLERETGRVKVDLMNPSWLIFSEGFSMSVLSKLGSRALDVAVTMAMLVTLSPLMLFAALAIWIEDGSPVLYRQQRVGLMGKVFTVYKFRSMVKNAEADGKARWAGASDQRVTRVGRIFRKLRVDELPQLLNVLRSDMSLVGPRPERPEFVDRLSATIPYYHERHVVKPGLTGWAQLCYPYGSSEQDAMEKLQYDLYYIKHKSVVFDLMVLLQTVEVVFWGKGAR